MNAKLFLLYFTLSSLWGDVVDIYMTAGQSNAHSGWSGSIESKIRELTPEREIRFIRPYHPGAALEEWWDDGPQELYYQDVFRLLSVFKEVYEEGDTPNFSGFFWFQGETDSDTDERLELYTERFSQMIDQLKRDASVSALLGAIVLIDMESGYYDDARMIRVNRMRQIHKDIADSLGLQTVDSRGVERRDAWHVLTSDLNTLGIRCAESFFISKSGASPFGCKLSFLNDNSLSIEFTSHPNIESWTIEPALGTLSPAYSITEIGDGKYRAVVERPLGQKAGFYSVGIR